MAAFSDYLEDALVDHIFANTDYSRPATIYVSLHTESAEDDGTGAEVSGGDYARLGIDTGASTEWTVEDEPSGGGRQAKNTSELTFTEASADWGTVSHFGLWDAASAGNLLFHGALPSSVEVASGSTAKIAAGALKVILR